MVQHRAKIRRLSHCSKSHDQRVSRPDGRTQRLRVEAHVAPAMNYTPHRLSQVVALLILAAVLAAGSRGSAAATPSSATAASKTGLGNLRLVAIGDSIPYNGSQDCPGCTGFVDRYARAVEKATG